MKNNFILPLFSIWAFAFAFVLALPAHPVHAQVIEVPADEAAAERASDPATEDDENPRKRRHKAEAIQAQQEEQPPMPVGPMLKPGSKYQISPTPYAQFFMHAQQPIECIPQVKGTIAMTSRGTFCTCTVFEYWNTMNTADPCQWQ